MRPISRAPRLGGWSLAVCALVTPALAQTLASSPPRGDAAQITPIVSGPIAIDHYSVQKLSLPNAAGGAFSVALALDDAAVVLELRPHSLRGNDFELRVAGADGVPRGVLAPPPRTLRGEIAGEPESRVAGSLLDAGLSALVRRSDGTTWVVQPLADFCPGAGRGEQIVFRAADTTTLGRWGCAADETRRAPDDAPAGGGLAGTGLFVADLAYDSDVEFYTQNGMSVPNTLYDIENISNVVAELYETQLQITFEITLVVVRTATDPFENNLASGMLSLFQQHWNTNFGALRRDLAHLMTGRVLDNDTLGIANIGVVCNPQNAYGLSRSRFSQVLSNRALVTRHEIGHNWNAVHCDGNPDCRIMCATFCACGSTCEVFGADSAALILAHRDSRICLSDSVAPLSPPFFDDFSEMAVSAARWSYNQGATLSSIGIDPPSPPQTLLLNAAGNQTYQDDEIRTTPIQLGGETQVLLSYHTQHRFVELNEQLFVDYYSATSEPAFLGWVQLQQLTSDGLDQEQFDFWWHVLPPDALHDGFRLRFRAEVNAVDDRWFVDDVRVQAVRTLSLDSNPIQAPLMISPADAALRGDGTAPLSRLFPPGTDVTLTAPPTHAGQTFARWVVNGENQAEGAASVMITLNDDSIAVAEFATVSSVTLAIGATPADGFLIAVAPADVNGASDGVTPMERVYAAGTPVTLTAPARTSTHTFDVWTVAGVPQTSRQNELTHTADASAALTARYVVIGDMNGDDRLNNFDIDAFVLAITDPVAYQAQFPGLDPVQRGDANGDGLLNNFDINGFVELLAGQ
ncbi:MAG: M12 family metallo-peptidase [Phycisphaerae bacterium]